MVASNIKMKKVILLGSSNKNGETKKVVDALQSLSGWDVIDLNDYAFSYFDYEHLNRTDDYLPLLKTITSQYDVLIFATPVYWYAMSGIMKVFFDRLTDVLEIEKELGRTLCQKYMAVLSCSNGDNLGDAFWLPFIKTADYLEMQYITNLHTLQGAIDREKLIDFVACVENESLKK